MNSIRFVSSDKKSVTTTESSETDTIFRRSSGVKFSCIICFHEDLTNRHGNRAENGEASVHVNTTHLRFHFGYFIFPGKVPQSAPPKSAPPKSLMTPHFPFFFLFLFIFFFRKRDRPEQAGPFDQRFCVFFNYVIRQPIPDACRYRAGNICL